MGQFRFMPVKEQEKLGISARHFESEKKNRSSEKPRNNEIKTLMASASKPTLVHDSSIESMTGSLSQQHILLTGHKNKLSEMQYFQ